MLTRRDTVPGMLGTRPWRVAMSLSVAVFFGFCVALLKGQDAGLRDAVGNLSAPWLLVAFWCGSIVRARSAGAVVGVVATSLALTGFCLGLALISDYGTHSAGSSIDLAIHANTRYFQAGLISGPLLGVLGAMTRHRTINRFLVSGLFFSQSRSRSSLHVAPATSTG